MIEEIIKNRRSVFPVQYNSEEISRETIQKIPSDFKYKKLQTNPSKASYVIAICMQRDPKESLPEWEVVNSESLWHWRILVFTWIN